MLTTSILKTTLRSGHGKRPTGGHHYSMSLDQHNMESQKADKLCSRLKFKEGRPNSQKKLTLTSNKPAIGFNNLPMTSASLLRNTTDQYTPQCAMGNRLKRQDNAMFFPSQKCIRSAEQTPNSPQISQQYSKMVSRPMGSLRNSCCIEKNPFPNPEYFLADSKRKNPTEQSATQLDSNALQNLRLELCLILKGYTDDFKINIYQQDRKMSTLEAKLEANQRLIEEKDKKIASLSNLHQNSRFLSRKIQQLQKKVDSLNTTEFSVQQEINSHIASLEQYLLGMVAVKLNKLKGKVSKLIDQTEKKVESVESIAGRLQKSLQSLQQARKLIQRLDKKSLMFTSFKSFGSSSKSEDNLTKDTTSNQFSLSKLQDFQLPKEQFSSSVSQDYFMYPVKPSHALLSQPSGTVSSEQELLFNEKLKSFMESLFNRKQPLQCFFDGGGHLKYTDSGTYIFDRMGNLISLSSKQKQYLISRHLISLDDPNFKISK